MRLAVELAKAATPRQPSTVSAAPSRMPRVAPMRSTSRPAGTEQSPDTT